MEISYIIKLIEERVAQLRKEIDVAKTQKAECECTMEKSFQERTYTAAYQEWYKLTEALTHLR